MASGVTGSPAVPAFLYCQKVGDPSQKHPPQPETYTFSQRSTKNAVGEIFGKDDGGPKVIEYTNAERSGCSFEINCLPPGWLNGAGFPGGATNGQAPVVCPVTYGNPSLSN